MSDGEALLAAVRADPADDLPRLAYADWLEETGGACEMARAEFIRVQCELWPLRDAMCKGFSWHTGDCIDRGRCNRAMRLRDRERALLAGDFCRFGVRVEGFTSVYCRGFVAEIRCTQADWLAHGKAVAAAHPLERVRLTDRKPRRFGEYEWATCEYRRAGHPHEPADFDLDAGLWNVLFEVIKGGAGVDRTIWWLARDTEEGIQDALSRACLLWAGGAE